MASLRACESHNLAALVLVILCTVQPRLSGPRLSGTLIIRTCLRLADTLVRMRGRRGR